MKPGIRVIRGPDWCQGNADGGPGYLGTVVKVYPSNSVLVQWDIGSETECRAGQDGFVDLRIYDNAQLGVNHHTVYCDGACVEKSIPGIRWKCLVCCDTDKCTKCYMSHSTKARGTGTMGESCVTHPHVRYTTFMTTVVRVPPRRKSKRFPLVGIFPGSEVTKRVLSSKEDEARVGKVKDIILREPDAYRSAVTVEWEGVSPKKSEGGTPELPIYRLGADGKVELKMVNKPESPWHVYYEHLPVLDLTMPLDITFNVGDKVRVDLNLEAFTTLMKEYGKWAPEVEQILGEEGTITTLVSDRAAEIHYEKIGKTAEAVYLNCLTKISNLSAGDTVKIISDGARMKKLQTGHGGWQDAYVSILGETGHVIRIDESQDALVEVNGITYNLNLMSLVLVSSEAKPNVAKNESGTKQSSQRDPVKRQIPKAAVLPQLRPGESVGVGTRVVRGPDWSPDFEDQDGGEGHLGSVVELCGRRDNDTYPKQCLVVQWDNGERNVYRAGYEKAFDLRVYDNAGIGIKHDLPCSECKIGAIFGMRWICSTCPDVVLCSECYNGDKHDIQHQFLRADTGTSDHGVKVPKRAMSKKIAASGIFEKAKVQRGPDWRWHNQDGGSEKKGEVIAIVNFSPDSDRDAAEVTWENGYTNVYRLGYKGRLDVKCVRPVSGACYYRDHIPVLKLEDLDQKSSVAKPKAPKPTDETSSTKSSEDAAGTSNTRFSEGDRVKIEIDVDILKVMEETRGAWNDRMTECIGKTGTVILSRGIDITVDFETAGRWTFHETVLNKVKEFVPGEVVQVNDSMNHVRMLQKERGGWNEMMSKVIGRRGTVEEIDEDGDVRVSFGDYTWTLNPECLVKSQQKAERIYEDDEAAPPSVKEPESSSVNKATSEDRKLEDLFGAIFSGETGRVHRIIERDPQLMLMDLDGKFAIHLACHRGQQEVVEELFNCGGKEALLELEDPEKNTPLLAAVKGDQVDMVEFLVQKGAKKNATNQSSQTAVHLAVFNKNKPLLNKLQELQFDINIKDMLNQSAIVDAIVSNDNEIVKIVLDWPCVDVEYKDSVGLSPFCIACRKGNILAVKKILGIAPGELNNPKQDGFTGLHLAVLNNNDAVVQFLLQQKGIEIEAKTGENERTPLHVACAEGFLDVAKLLLGHGADPTSVDSAGRGCLHLCVEVTSEKEKSPEKCEAAIMEMASYLLDVGVPSTMKDKSDKLPEHYVSQEMVASFQTLMQHRPKVQSLPNGDQAGRGRTNSEPRAPISLPTTPGQGQMSQSMYNQGPASIDDTSGRIAGGRTPGGQGQANSGGPVNGDTIYNQQQDEPVVTNSKPTPEMCESCEEEPMRYRIEPCGHYLCADCIPTKKQKKKRCAECGEGVVELVEVR